MIKSKYMDFLYNLFYRFMSLCIIGKLNLFHNQYLLIYNQLNNCHMHYHLLLLYYLHIRLVCRQNLTKCKLFIGLLLQQFHKLIWNMSNKLL